MYLGWWPDNKSHFLSSYCFSLPRRSELLSWEGGTEPHRWDGRSHQDELLESIPGHPQGVHGAMTREPEVLGAAVGGTAGSGLNCLTKGLHGTQAPALGSSTGAQR